MLGATTRQTVVDEILGHPKVESLATELREKPESKDLDGSLQMSLGAFQHGSVVGLSTLSRSHPELVQKVVVAKHTRAISQRLSQSQRSKLRKLSLPASGAQ